jgi:hypothetical protein
MKKWTEGTVAGIYSAVLPTEKKKYYFKLFRRWSFENPSVNFEFCTIVFNYPPYFSQSVGNLTQSEMHLMQRPLEFTQTVGDFVSNIDSPTQYQWTWIRRQSRWWWLWHFQGRYCEMPMDWNPSATSSVIIVAIIVTLLWNADGLESVCNVVGDSCGIYSDATVKCWRTGIRPQRHRWWLWHLQWHNCKMLTDWNPSATSSVMVVAFPVTLLWNADEMQSVHNIVGDGCGISSDATVKCRRTVIRRYGLRWQCSVQERWCLCCLFTFM